MSGVSGVCGTRRAPDRPRFQESGRANPLELRIVLVFRSPAGRILSSPGSFLFSPPQMRPDTHLRRIVWTHCLLDHDGSCSDGEIPTGDDGPRRDREKIRSAAHGTRRPDGSHRRGARRAASSASGMVRAPRHACGRRAGVRDRRAVGVRKRSSLPWRGRRRRRRSAHRDARKCRGAYTGGRVGERQGALAAASIDGESGRGRRGGGLAAVGAVRPGGTIALRV